MRVILQFFVIILEVLVMRKKLIISIAIGTVICALGCMFIILCDSNQPLDIKEFSLLNFQWEIETFPSDKNVGQVDDANTAIEKAKELWIEKFSVIGGKPYDPVDLRKIEVAYDSTEECWHIYGTLPKNTLGGVPHAIIRKNGDVIAVWQDD